MKTITLTLLISLTLYCKVKDQFPNEHIIKTFLSNDKKIKIIMSDSNNEDLCGYQPIDNTIIKRICYFRIINEENGNVLYEISPADEKLINSNSKKCVPANFPLAIAYGFDKFYNNENIIFTDSFGWYGSNETYEYTYKFNWKKCEKINIGSLVESHLMDNSSLYFVSNEKHRFAFYFYSGEDILTIGKLTNSETELHDDFFEDIKNATEGEKFKFRKNVEIISEKKINNASFNLKDYSYPIVTFKFKEDSIIFDIFSENLK